VSGYRLLENASLAGRNTFRVRAHAELLADVHDPAALPELFSFKALREGSVLVLGAGSNVLFVDRVPGVVVSLTMHDIRILVDHDRHAIVRAEAGVAWNDLVHWTLGRGLLGLENLVLIPGTVGAAPIQNIGAYGVEVGEFIEVVEAFDRHTLQPCRLGREQCAFGYRDSVFKREPGRWVVTAVEFRLPRQRELVVRYAGVPEELAAMGVSAPRAAHVAEAIARLRTRKLPNPMLLGNAGSFFKNPLLPRAQVDTLAAQFPGLPVFPAAQPDEAKISAAWLIEQCGLKGHRVGDAGVSAQHSLVLVNHANASGREILELAQHVADTVFARFAVALEPEPRIVGGSWPQAST
jgi:UDP-N-acetylmuramate dehydrogenase